MHPGANGDKRELMPLTPATIAQALDRSPDGGVTLVLSKLNLSDVSAEAAEELATVGRDVPEDESTIERITLGTNHLTTLPTEFALLSRLRYLNLKHNNFSNFPDVLTVMPNLDTLDISHNKIKRFPAHPGRLLDLRVFSFTKNKITRLPSYFPQFRRLELLKLDRNPIEWPPRNVLQNDASHSGEKEMKEWIANILDWVDYNTSPLRINDDSGYSETMDWDTNAKQQDKHKAWKFPLHDVDGERGTPSHSRTYSVDSQASASSLLDESFAEVDSTGTAHFKRSFNRPIVTAPDHSPIHPSDEYLPSPADSEKFEAHSGLPHADLPDLNRVQPLHLRASSVAAEHRAPSSVSGKNSLPDLRSPQWSILSHSPEQSFSDFMDSQSERPTPDSRQNSTPNESDSQQTNPTQALPSMAFERNSYFHRLSTMPTSTKLPASLTCLVETARSILFVTSQIYQTIEHYANNAIDEKHSPIFRRILEPANTDMVQLIQALDRFDSTSQKGLPPPPVCRAIAETCRNTVTATGKAVGMFAIQLRVAPCEDHRYSRWILLELYASTAEISVAWQNVLPHMQDLKGFLHGKLAGNYPPALLQAPLFGPPPNQSRQDPHYPAPRLRNTDLNSLRTHNARRHAGSFSYRDVELGKVLPSIDEPPSFSGGVAGQFPTLRTPKRQVTAPVLALAGSVSLPGPHQPIFSLSRSEGTTLTRHSREHSLDQPLRSAPTNYSAGPKLKSLDLPSNVRPKPDRDALQSIRQSLDSAPKFWDMIGDAITPSDTTSRELVKKGRDLSRKLSTGLRSAMDNDRAVDSQLNENVHQLLKLLAQISSLVKNGTLARPASPTLHAYLTRLTDSAEELSKMRSASFLSSSSSRPYSPLFSNPFISPANLEDNRLSSSLSRTRSAQPTPSLKTSLGSFHDSPRSALPTSSFKIPTIHRVTSSRESRGDMIDPG